MCQARANRTEGNDCPAALMAPCCRRAVAVRAELADVLVSGQPRARSSQLEPARAVKRHARVADAAAGSGRAASGNAVHDADGGAEQQTDRTGRKLAPRAVAPRPKRARARRDLPSPIGTRARRWAAGVRGLEVLLACDKDGRERPYRPASATRSQRRSRRASCLSCFSSSPPPPAALLPAGRKLCLHENDGSARCGMGVR